MKAQLQNREFLWPTRHFTTSDQARQSWD